MITSVPIIKLRTASVLTKYDFPAPDVANTVKFAFSKENLSKIIKDSFCEFIPYKTPVSEESSADVKGKVVETEVVSIFLVIERLSLPYGAVDKNPSF